jgi:acyl-CoA hydrolase
MSWFDEYKKKKCSFEEAVAVVKSNERVYISGNAATPFKLMEALEHRHKELQNVEIAHVLLFGDEPLTKPGMEGHFRHNSLFVGPGDRKAVNEGKADYIPVFLYEIPSLFRSGLLPIDVAFMHLSPPDEHGFMSYGVECLASKAAAESAKKVVAMVNEKMPRALGDAFIHTSRISKLVEVSIDLPELQPIPFTEVEKKIGANIAGLVEDGSTLQLGIGGIPNAALKAMFDKRDLGVHTEMVSDSIIEAIDAGVITGARKTLHTGKVIATFFLGTKKIYEYIDNNPTFETHPAEYTNHPFIIGQNEKMVAINSAIEVDLTGQICSDSIGTKIYSGFGGQVDFIRGAAQSKGGKPIIALPSTAKSGKLSKIVPTLQVGAGVVTTRADVHYVVTEYGVAYLHGKNLRQRAEALIGISHPDFRESLTTAAKERKLL